MPTKLPRVFLTLAEADAEKMDALADLFGRTRPWVLRKALREMAKKHLKR